MNFAHFVGLAALVFSSPFAAGAQTVHVAAEPDRYLTGSESADSYRLGVGDKIRVTVYNEPTLSGEFAVASNGNLSLPLIGDVPASGKDAPEVAAEVQSALADGFMKSPQVSAEVTQYRPFFILGEVKTPGQYPYSNGLTVMNAIATAQGFTPRAEKKRAYIRRAGENGEKAYPLTSDLKVLPGDTIRLGERYF